MFFYDIHMLRAEELLEMSEESGQPLHISTPFTHIGFDPNQTEQPWLKFIKCGIGSFLFFGCVSIVLQLFIRELLNIWMVVFSILEHICRGHEEGIALIRRYLPWIGMRLALMFEATNESVKKGTYHFYIAQIFQFLLFFGLLQVVYWNGASIFLYVFE